MCWKRWKLYKNAFICLEINEALPEKHEAFHFHCTPGEFYYEHVGYKLVANYEVCDEIYTIKTSGTGERQNYCPTYLWHINVC